METDFDQFRFEREKKSIFLTSKEKSNFGRQSLMVFEKSLKNEDLNNLTDFLNISFNMLLVQSHFFTFLQNLHFLGGKR